MKNSPVESEIGKIQFALALSLLYWVIIILIFISQTRKNMSILEQRPKIYIISTRVKFLIIWVFGIVVSVFMVICFERSLMLSNNMNVWLDALREIELAYECTSEEVWIDLDYISESTE